MISDVLRGGIADAVTEVRQILDDLGPMALTEDGLGEALRSQLASMASHVPLEVRIRDLPPLNAEVEAAVYRVVGEAVNNAIRHANASHIDVEIHMSDAEMLVCISDDGDGFSKLSPTGIGLQSMTGRARNIGGRLTVESSDAGSTVTLSVPIGVKVP